MFNDLLNHNLNVNMSECLELCQKHVRGCAISGLCYSRFLLLYLYVIYKYFCTIYFMEKFHFTLGHVRVMRRQPCFKVAQLFFLVEGEINK
jgi:hypothetical protein